MFNNNNNTTSINTTDNKMKKNKTNKIIYDSYDGLYEFTK